MPATNPPETQTHPVDAAHARRQRWLMLVTFFLLLIALFVSFRFWAAKRFESKVQAIRDRGEPVEFEDLVAGLPKLIDKEQTAPDLYRTAFSLIAKPSEEQSKSIPIIGTDLPANTDPISPEMLVASQQHLARNAPALKLLHEAVHKGPPFRPELWTDIESVFQNASLETFLKAAELFALEAVIAAEVGDTPHAVLCLGDAWVLSGRLAEKPYFMIDHLVRVAMAPLAVSILERIVNRGELADAELQALADMLADDGGSNVIHRALLAERVFALASFPDEVIGEISYSRPFGDTAPRAIGMAYIASGLYDLDRYEYLEHMERGVEIARMPLPQRYREMQKVVLNTSGVRYLYTRLSDSSGGVYGRFVLLDARPVARIRLARAAVAVERYRLAEGKLPDTLQAVAPRFIDAVSLDPFTGKPLVYKKLGVGYTIYSLGEDATDHGGAKTNPAGDQYEPGSDIPFTIAR